MKANLGWILLGVLILVLLLVVPGIFFFGHWGGGYGMMGPGGMMGRGFWTFPLGGVMMLSAVLIPLGVLILVVVGVVWLVNNLSRSGRAPADRVPPVEQVPPAPGRNCPNCGKPVQDDWKACPYCGTSLSG